ncbi:MAG: arginine--tRNA ligase [Lachnospiraceae bacterium]|nr:arginine--tRNA ligase [Lachnospiraceae bacterium]
MKKIIDVISAEVMSAFEKKGYDANYGKVTLSNRPDLCEYQCNGALAAAKVYKKAPFMISDEVAEELKSNSMFESVESVKPGFLNIILSGEFVKNYITDMENDEKYGVEDVADKRTVMLDFGGPNVAKPLHVGHLRSAIIGESVKRILRYKGDNVIGDVHLGDWGLQMGLIITELKLRKPELVYFDDSYTGEYPTEAPFTIAELEEIYPTASAKSKEDPEYKDAALKATVEVQKGKPGYRALLGHILNVSVTDLKKNYENLNVSFDLWKGESDADPYIPEMVEMMKRDGFAYESDGALVVDVKEESDTKEIPPCMILKSDGAALYDTTDLATLVWRERDYKPSEVIYVVDKRQELHFIQVFRCAKKTGIVNKDTKLTFLGFGTMNGKDGKPFKTREGGVMRLEHLLASINEEMLKKISENNTMGEEEAKATSKTVALAAIKYGDLSNQASKDYIFDIDRFTSFEGNTGPYILYTIVRIKSILSKYAANGGKIEKGALLAPKTDSEKELMLALTKYAPAIDVAYSELAPHKICAYIYELSNAFNHFYHETKIMGEEDKARQSSYIALLELTRGVLEQCIDLLGFEAPERM